MSGDGQTYQQGGPKFVTWLDHFQIITLQLQHASHLPSITQLGAMAVQPALPTTSEELEKAGEASSSDPSRAEELYKAVLSRQAGECFTLFLLFHC